MMHAVEMVSGKILWANLHLLFWLSMVPFVTAWMGENHFAPTTLALYGMVLLMAAIAYYILEMSLIHHHGPDSLLSKAVGKNKKGQWSVALYIIGISTSFFSQWISGAMYILVAIMWLIPDMRIEKAVEEKD